MSDKNEATAGREPWPELRPEVADLIEPELDRIAAETIEAIAREVPEYARPLEGSFGTGIRTGVEEALRQFVALVRDPGTGRGVGREVYVELGRGELRQGRTLDSLQAAYRVGARVAWRRISAAGRRSGLDPEALSLLAEAIFAYIDELSADSVEGYAEARSELEDRQRRARHDLVELLVSGRPPEEAELRAAARAAGWAVPRTAAALACEEADAAEIARGLPGSALVATVAGSGCLIVADPAGPGRAAELRRAVAEAPAALGPAGATGELASSWRLAQVALAALRDGSLPGPEGGATAGLLLVEDHLGDLLLLGRSELTRMIAARRLGPLDGLTPRAAERMAETALAYVRRAGNSVAMAREMGVHPQTARYRVGRLRELLGEQLEDPDARFEIELALRARRLSAARGRERLSAGAGSAGS